MSRPLLRLLAVVGVVLVSSVVVTEVVMQPSPAERPTLYGVYGVTAVATVVVFVVAAAIQRRARSLRTSIRLVAVGSVAVAALAVLLAAQTMFLSGHDRTLVLVALALGVALGAVLAVVVAGSLGSDLARVRQAAERVASGDLTARAGVERADELGDAARAFDRMVERLDATERERRLLLASVGHDLRTPLASLRAAIEALEDGVAPDPQAYLAGMGRDVGHLTRLVEDLFLLARVEAGRLDLTPEPVDLAELCDETAEALGPLAGERGVRIQVDCDGPIPVTLDPWAMGRVLRNLVDNALRHSPPHGRVWLRAQQSDGRVELSVEDEGPGFPPELADRAFDGFTSGDPARGRNGGAGLGLAIARGIVEAHGGTLTLEPPTGDSTGAHLRLTLAARTQG